MIQTAFNAVAAVAIGALVVVVLAGLGMFLAAEAACGWIRDTFRGGNGMIPPSMMEESPASSPAPP